MVLVDTSVWVRFLSHRDPYVEGLSGLLGEKQVLGHPFVYGELLIGDPGGRLAVLEAYTEMHRAEEVSHGEVAQFARVRRLHGRGIGWIDVHLLASALVSDASLWTADSRLRVIAAELGIEHTAS